MVEKRSLLKERLTLGLETVGLVIALVLPSSHIALVAIVIAFLLWIVPDCALFACLTFCGEQE